MAAKIVSVSKPNQVLVGEGIYRIVLSSRSSHAMTNYKDGLNSTNFREVTLDPIKWKYLSPLDTESVYLVYEYLVN
jgi:hypothetical protein